MLSTFPLDNASEMSKWDEFVESHPNGSPFHLSCWLHTIHETYAFKPLLFVDKEENGDISGILPCFFVKGLLTGKRIVSLPFSDYGGPLFRDLSKERDVLKEIIKEHESSVKYIEIRSPLIEDSGFVCHNYYKHHVLNLGSDLAAIRKKINKRTIQYSIRKAEKMGVEIREENNQYGMDEFYRLNMMTRKKHGVPSQPKLFFQKLLDHVVSKGHAFILLAIFNSKAVASSIFFKSNNTIHYKYNASDPDYMKRTSPNHSLTWYAIRQGCEKGYRLLDFGRTSPDNKGLMRYKELWGTKALDLEYHYHPQIKGASSTEENSLFYRSVTNVWRTLPDVVIEKIGPMIYKHMG